MKFGHLKGRQVINVADAQKVGEIDDVLLDLGLQKVLGFLMKEPGLFSGQKALPLGSVKAIGPEAVTIENTDALGDLKDFPALKDAETRGQVEGSRVITDGGKEVGTVRDIDADFSTGAITGYVLGASLLNRLQHEEHVVPVSLVKNIGEKLIVVADEVAPAAS